ncbi:MAG: hypothetical protein Q3999_05660 [Buchananella hordeovulneris]|nr:hypothetical protein [Buchananella hordeovulneris]
MALRGNWEHETWILKNGGVRLEVASRGAVVLSWKVPTPRGPRELIDGYVDDADLASGHGARSAVLAPWSNRIEAGRYEFDGRVYQLPTGADGHALHGLVTGLDFALTDSGPDFLTFETRIEPSEGYPFPVKVQATYRLEEGEGGAPALALELSATNEGEVDAPIGLGWHPYLALTTADLASVSLLARSSVEVDPGLIPLAGESAFSAAGRFPVCLGSLGEVELDDAFTELEVTHAGVNAVLRGPNLDQIALESDLPVQKRGEGIVHFYTGDTLDSRQRDSVAVEPCQFMTNAFNRPELADSLRVAPGQSTSLRARFVYLPMGSDKS